MSTFAGGFKFWARAIAGKKGGRNSTKRTRDRLQNAFRRLIYQAHGPSRIVHPYPLHVLLTIPVTFWVGFAFTSKFALLAFVPELLVFYIDIHVIQNDFNKNKNVNV